MMKFAQPTSWRTLQVWPATLLVLALLAGGVERARAQSAPADLTPALQRVVVFAREGMSDDFILAVCVTNAGVAYTLSADDIIYLHKQGVSDPVVRSLIEAVVPVKLKPAEANPSAGSSLPGNGIYGPSAATKPSTPPVPLPPPLDEASPALSYPVPVTVPAEVPATSVPDGLQENFAAEPALAPGRWDLQSGALAGLGETIPPVAVCSWAGLELAGADGGGFTGIASRPAYPVPFTFSATVGPPVSARKKTGPLHFEVYLVTDDLQQWVGVAGCLQSAGGSAGTTGPAGGNGTEDWGLWLNHTGSGQPVTSRGYQIYYDPGTAGPYTVQVIAGTNGAAAVTLLDTNGTELAAQMVPAGRGPFHVVLGGRTGPAAGWRKVQLTPLALPAAPEEVAVPPAPTLDYFQAQLTPYGTWTTLPQYGLCWRPAVPSGWRPYYDGGRWVDTDAGWYWHSDYPWGDLTFHYGRWAYTTAGWVWVPGYDYASAWVVWRHADAAGYVGWAPVPPGAVWVDGLWVYQGTTFGAGADFGLRPEHYTFVADDRFWSGDYRRSLVPGNRLEVIYRTSEVANGFAAVDGRLANTGVDRERLAAFTARVTTPVPVAPLQAAEENRDARVRAVELRRMKPGAKPDALKVVRDGTGG